MRLTQFSDAPGCSGGLGMDASLGRETKRDDTALTRRTVDRQ